MHVIPKGWKSNGNADAPTFTPSVKITGKQRVIVDGRWDGEWVRDAAGNPLDYCCHYFVTAGELQYQNDCTHALKSKTVALPEIPDHLRD